MKKSWWVLLLAAGVFLFSQFALAEVTIDWWVEGVVTEDFKEYYIKSFEALHPEVKIELNQVPSQNMIQLVPIAIASGEPPNVLYDYLGRLGAWSAMDVLVPLNDLYTAEEWEDFLLLEAFTNAKGELYGIPMRCWAIPYTVDFNMLKEVGLDGEALGLQDDFTLDTWMMIAEKVKAAGYYATAFFCNGASGDYWFLTNYRMFGANLYEGGVYDRTTLNSEAGIEALEWMGRLVEEGYAPPGVAGLSDGNFLNYIATGTIAMLPNMADRATETYETTNFKDGKSKRLQDNRIVPTPHKEGAPTSGLYVGPTGIVVFDNSNPEVVKWSKEFAKFFTSTESMAQVQRATSQFPARKSVEAVWPGPEWGVVENLLAKYGSSDMGLASPKYLKCRYALFPEHQAFFAGMKTAEEALNDFAAMVEKIWAEED